MAFPRARKSTVWLVVCSALLAAVVVSCRTTGTTLAPGAPIELAPGQGLLVVHVSSEVQVETIDIGPRTRIALHAEAGEQVVLVAVEAGSYAWQEVRLRYSPDSCRALLGTVSSRCPPAHDYRIAGWGDTSFEVEAGRLNFAGFLELRRPSWFFLRGRVIDRTARGLALVAERHPGVLERYPFGYSGSARHVFSERYQGALAEGAQAASGGMAAGEAEQ